jgi:hypothetical protein
MARGRQSLLLRKGGIAEGKGGFRWRHPAFFLFPTHFHEQAQSVTEADVPAVGSPPSESDDHAIPLTLFARIERSGILTDRSRVEALAPFHIWKPQVVEDRFGFGPSPGLAWALIRPFSFEPPWLLQPSRSFAGCRSWVDLPHPPALALRPVVPESEFDALRRRISQILPEAG